MNRRTYRFVLLVALATGIFSTEATGAAVFSKDAYAAAEVRGRVIDQNGEALAGATVVLREDRTDRQRYGTATGREGWFLLDDVQPGTYRLVASYVGFADVSMRIDVADGEVVERTVELAELAIPQQEVVVTATRARPGLTPITFTNLTARELEEQPAMKDLPVLLSSLPSTTYHSENGNGIGYSTLRMRGFDQRRIAVAINGIPQNDPEDFNVFWINFFDIQGAIQDIQVQRGAGSSFYGSTAIGGAINIVATPYRPEAYARAEVGAGSFGTRRYTAEANTGLMQDRYVAFGRFSRLLTDGYRDWSWSRFYRFFGGVARYGERSTLMLQTYGGPQEDGLAYSGVPKAANDSEDDRRFNFSSFTRDLENFHQPHVELLHDLDLTTDTRFHQALFWVKGEGFFDFGATFRSPDYLRLPAGFRGMSPQERALPLFLTAPDVSVLFRAYLDQWQVGWLPHATHRSALGETTVGAEARLHRSVRWGRIQEADGIPSELVGTERDVRVYQFRGEKLITSVYGSHLARPAERIAIQADLQVTRRHYRVYDEEFFGHSFRLPYLFINPRLGVTLNPERPLSGYASIALAQREPRLKSLYDGEEAGAGFEPRFARGPGGAFDYSDPLIKPERLVDLELGVALDRTRYRAAATTYLMEFRDEIVPSGGLDQFNVPRTGNADRTRHLGIELEGALRLMRGLDLYANATASRNRFIRFSEFVTLPNFTVVEVEQDGNQIAGFPERIANLGVRYRRGGATLAVDGKYAGKQFIDNSGGRNPDGTPNPDLELEPYTLINASLQYEFRPRSPLHGLRLALDVNNVLDEKVLLFGNVGPAGPQFFPAATRHLFFSARYTLK